MEEKMQGVLQPIVEPRVIEVDKEDLDRPMSQAGMQNSLYRAPLEPS